MPQRPRCRSSGNTVDASQAHQTYPLGCINTEEKETHEKQCEEPVSLGVTLGLVRAAAFLNAVDRCDDQRKYKRQHDDSQRPLASEADEAEALAATQSSE